MQTMIRKIGSVKREIFWCTLFSPIQDFQRMWGRFNEALRKLGRVSLKYFSIACLNLFSKNSFPKTVICT
jgi:hypothetical protein